MFEVGKFFNGITKGGGKTRKFFTDPIKISFILAAIIIIIIYFIFRDIIDEDESFFHVMFRAGLFVLIAVVSVVFLLNKNLEGYYEDKYSDTGAKNIVERGVESAAEDVDVTDLKSETITGKGESSSTSTKKEDGRVNVNITVNDVMPSVDSGAFKPPK